MRYADFVGSVGLGRVLRISNCGCGLYDDLSRRHVGLRLLGWV